jgi:hypothetical protein
MAGQCKGYLIEWVAAADNIYTSATWHLQVLD